MEKMKFYTEEEITDKHIGKKEPLHVISLKEICSLFLLAKLSEKPDNPRISLKKS